LVGSNINILSWNSRGGAGESLLIHSSPKEFQAVIQFTKEFYATEYEKLTKEFLINQI